MPVGISGCVYGLGGGGIQTWFALDQGPVELFFFFMDPPTNDGDLGIYLRVTVICPPLTALRTVFKPACVGWKSRPFLAIAGDSQDRGSGLDHHLVTMGVHINPW